MIRQFCPLIVLCMFQAAQCMEPSGQPVGHLQPGQIQTVSDDVTLVGEQLSVCRFKQQAVQSVKVSAGWLSATTGNDLSNSFFEASIEVGVPLGSFDNILGVTPFVRTDFNHADPTIDIPSELYETGVSFFHRRSLGERLSLLLIAKPSIRSDLTTSRNAFRTFGMGLVNWKCVPDRVVFSVGAVFLDRSDLPLLPAVGVTWTPDSERRLELRFPESRYLWQMAADGRNSETWGYVTVGIGGNTWAVTRASGVSDEVSLRDIRLMLGCDHIIDGGGGWFVEAGLALNRRIEYESTASEIGLSNGVIVQAGWRY